jgi:cytochrome d ubiquinol oxidase subunit II
MLAELPMLFILVGLAAYTVLAGADFGAGFWTLFAGGGSATPAQTRDHARHAIGPVWEANHVWLIFVLVVCWTAYPVAYASIVSSLAAPLLLAAVGIVLRGATYALRSQLDDQSGRRAVERVFAISSIFTPFAMGTIAGAIATGRVPVGTAAGALVTSWLNPMSIVVGLLAVATSVYLAAVYLAADAGRLHEPVLERDFRRRALWSGLAAGVFAAIGIVTARFAARPLWHGLTTGWGLAMLVLSAVAGVATLVLVWRNRFTPARLCAAVAVAAIVGGWAAAQRPTFLPGLTVTQAAAAQPVLVAVVVAVAIGAVVLIPALVLLFGLFLGGRLDHVDHDHGPSANGPGLRDRQVRRRLLGAFAAACLVGGGALMIFTEPGPTFVVAIAALCGFAVSTFVLATADAPDA